MFKIINCKNFSFRNLYNSLKQCYELFNFYFLILKLSILLPIIKKKLVGFCLSYIKNIYTVINIRPGMIIYLNKVVCEDLKKKIFPPNCLRSSYLMFNTSNTIMSKYSLCPFLKIKFNCIRIHPSYSDIMSSFVSLQKCLFTNTLCITTN